MALAPFGMSLIVDEAENLDENVFSAR